MLERQQLEFPEDSNLSKEMLHFVEQVGAKMRATTRTRSAESGFHDDSLMACAITFANIEEWGDRPNQANLLEGILR